MVDVTVESDRVVFQVEGWDKLWSLRSRLEIPLAHITGVEANTDQVNQWWRGLKVMGTALPGLFAAGTFYYHGELVFWDVRHPANTIIVSLDHERYRKLIIEVKDPGAVVAQLQTVGAAPHRPQPFRSTLSLAFPAATVCHCMLLGASAPPQASGLM
jgi:hypothetical protein